MKPLLFGVDSSAPADSGFLARVTQWAGQRPAFWARYLGSGGGAATPLSREEAAFLFAQGVAIALVFNDVDQHALGTAAEGEDAAARALAQARAIGVPAAVTIYADIEAGWQLTAPWLLGWIRIMLAHGQVPGVYVGLAQPVVQSVLHSLRAREPGLMAHLSLWDAQWAESSWDAPAGGMRSLPRWIRAQPSEDALQLGLWQFAGPSCGASVDLDLLDTQASPAPVLWTGKKG